MTTRKRLGIAALGLLAVGGAVAWVIERPRVTDIPFHDLPVSKVGFGAPEALEGFPDCAPEMLDMKIEDTDRHLDITMRPKPGVQCGLEIFPEAWWIDARGERFQARMPDSKFVGRSILLMGRNGATDTGGIEKACTMDAPITYFIEWPASPSL